MDQNTVPVSAEEYRLQQGTARRAQIGDDIIVFWLNEPNSISRAPAKVVAAFTPTLVNAVAFLDGSNQAHLGGSSSQLVKWVTSVPHISQSHNSNIWWDWA